MTIHQCLKIGLLVFLGGLIVFSSSVSADRGGRKSPKSPRVELEEKKYQKRNVRSQRFGVIKRKHQRYYPPRGQIRKRIPKDAYSLNHSGRRYYYHRGIWYHRHQHSYRVIRPPIGVVVPILPPFYTRIWVGSIPYYYAGGIYYVWEDDHHAYRVVDPPGDDRVELDHDSIEPLIVYPNKGQSDKQLGDDRYQCHRWALENTGFNPILPGGNVPYEQYSAKRSEYYRAIKACLEGRQYTVR